MSYLRVAAYEAVNDDIGAWDNTIGEMLRQDPSCIRSAASLSDGTWLVATEWTDQAACDASQESSAYAAALAELSKQFDVSADVEPVFLFEGEVAAGK